MFLSIASVMVLPLTCLMAKRLPQWLELASIAMVLIGVALVLQLHAAEYSLLGITFGLLATFLTANATIYSGKARNVFGRKRAMIAKQLGKLVFAVIGLTVLMKDFGPKDSELYLWILLGMYGLMKIYDTFIASRTVPAAAAAISKLKSFKPPNSVHRRNLSVQRNFHLVAVGGSSGNYSCWFLGSSFKTNSAQSNPMSSP